MKFQFAPPFAKLLQEKLQVIGVKPNPLTGVGTLSTLKLPDADQLVAGETVAVYPPVPVEPMLVTTLLGDVNLVLKLVNPVFWYD